MEPVPETERMEEFRSSPVPTLRLQAVSNNFTDHTGSLSPRPSTFRRSTDPTSSSPRSPGWSTPSLPFRPRNTSPLARGHVRSRSSTSALAPTMSRAQSMPGMNTASHLFTDSPQRPSSPAGSPHRNRTPRKPVDEVFPTLFNRSPIEFSQGVSAISEDDENEAASPIERSRSPYLGLTPGHAFPRSRRPSSPLRNVSAHSLPGSIMPSTPTSFTSSSSFPKPADSLATYNFSGSYASSSVPSTPNSLRSRSPSISSLETIPDTPDAEEAALEAERIAQLKAAADAADGADAADAAEEKRRGSLESAGARGRSLGAAFGTRDKRKRWSVCGAERRGDLNLDTIWED